MGEQEWGERTNDYAIDQMQRLHRRQANRHGTVFLTVPYTCSCGRKCKVQGMMAPNADYIGICPACLRQTVITAPALPADPQSAPRAQPER